MEQATPDIDITDTEGIVKVAIKNAINRLVDEYRKMWRRYASDPDTQLRITAIATTLKHYGECLADGTMKICKTSQDAMPLPDFIRAVDEMRKTQREYFSVRKYDPQKANTLLDKSKQLERKVDNLIKAAKEATQPKQAKLF